MPWGPSPFLFRFPSLLALGLSAAALTTACGDESTPAATGRPVCIDTPEPLASLDAMTPLGVTARTLLEYAQGPRTDAMHWRNEALDAQLNFSIGPETGVTQITTEVLPLNTPPRWVRSVPETSQGQTFDILDCPDYLEVDVQLRVETSGGALRELVPTTLVATNPHAAKVRYVSEPTKPAMGSFALTQTNPPGVILRNLSYNLSYTASSHHGELRGLAALNDDVAYIELGAWPEKPVSATPRILHDCLSSMEQFFLPHGETLLGFEASAVRDRIASRNPLLISPLVGEKLKGNINFAVTQDRACIGSIYEFADPLPLNQFGVSGLFEFDLGTVKTKVPAFALSSTDGQSITGIVIKSQWSSRRPFVGALSADAFRAAYGDLGVKLEGYRYFAIYAEAKYQRELPGSGTPPLHGGLQVIGINPRPRSSSGPDITVLARWDFRG